MLFYSIRSPSPPPPLVNETTQAFCCEPEISLFHVFMVWKCQVMCLCTGTHRVFMASVTNLALKLLSLPFLIFAEVTVFKSFEYYIMFSSVIIFYSYSENFDPGT